ncbi:MAG TPA: S1 RNA-binding domain-containing protein, partial [Chthoniobacterales bacterium]|nr:S1 RNA-binding domain-containing protein [Chthoniobacterales bacterium]
KDGLVHISELADFRVKKTEDVAKVGEMIWVKCIGIDDKGRVKLSRKAALKERAEAEGIAPETAPEGYNEGDESGGDDRGDRGDRGDGGHRGDRGGRGRGGRGRDRGRSERQPVH